MRKPHKPAPKEKRPEPLFCVIETTVTTPEQARHLARQLVQARLAACVQIGQIESHYLWEEKYRAEGEYRLSLKTRTSLWPPIQKFIAQHHPYDVPQIICLPLHHTDEAYGDWLLEATTSPALD